MIYQEQMVYIEEEECRLCIGSLSTKKKLKKNEKEKLIVV